MDIELWIVYLLLIWIAMISYGIYRKRFLLVSIFIILELAVILISYLCDNRDYRMHVAVFGTIALYLVTLFFLMFLLFDRFFKGKKSEDTE